LNNALKFFLKFFAAIFFGAILTTSIEWIAGITVVLWQLSFWQKLILVLSQMAMGAVIALIIYTAYQNKK
jgi:hypothetical protein